MTKTAQSLDELILAAKKRNNDEAVLELLDRVEQMDNEAFKGAAAQLHELCTGWDSLVSGSEAKANLCLKLAERDILNYVEEKREEKPAKGNKFSRPERIVTFRDVLYTAIRAMTPPYFGGEIVWNAIGAKNSTDSVSVVAARFRKLKSLQTNMLIYFTETKQWLRVDNFDKSKSSMSVRELNGTAYSSISVAGAVSKTIFFQADAVFCKMLKTNTTKLTGPQYRAKFCKYAVSDYSEKDLTDIVRKIFVPASMTQDEFEAWWNAEQKVEVKERGFFESRSVLEFYTSLQKMNDAGTPITITAESAEKVKHFLVKVSCLGGKVAGELYEYLLHPETAEDGANQKTRGQCFEYLSAVGIRGEVTKRLITGMNDFAKCEDKNELTDLQSELYNDLLGFGISDKLPETNETWKSAMNKAADVRTAAVQAGSVLGSFSDNVFFVSANSKKMQDDTASFLTLTAVVLSRCKDYRDAGVEVQLQDFVKKASVNAVHGEDTGKLADCISLLSNASKDSELLKDMFLPLRGEVPFWPNVISSDVRLSDLEDWGKMSIKILGGFIRVTRLLYTDDEMAQFATMLPLRCIGPVFATFENEEMVEKTISGMKEYTSDIILWIWKNRKTVSSSLKDSIDMGCAISALSADGLPKEWAAGQHELRKNLFDKADFQKFILGNADGDMVSITNALQKYRKFYAGERQSVLVKLARQSQEFQDYLEKGAGRKLLGVQAKKDIPVTSVKSLKRLNDELKNLVEVLIPENAAAVALAKSFGDLRENAEYDAAKERRRFLARRRTELENTLSDIRSTDFKSVRVKDHVVIGCLVKLESGADKKREFYLLGAWDGDPERGYISYMTKIGEAVLDKKVGAEVEIPEDGKYIIREVLPLPEDLRKELADEA